MTSWPRAVEGWETLAAPCMPTNLYGFVPSRTSLDDQQKKGESGERRLVISIKRRCLPVSASPYADCHVTGREDGLFGFLAQEAPPPPPPPTAVADSSSGQHGRSKLGPADPHLSLSIIAIKLFLSFNMTKKGRWKRTVPVNTTLRGAKRERERRSCRLIAILFLLSLSGQNFFGSTRKHLEFFVFFFLAATVYSPRGRQRKIILSFPTLDSLLGVVLLSFSIQPIFLFT